MNGPEPVRLVPLPSRPEPGREVTACRIEPPPPGGVLPCAGQLVELPPGQYDWVYLGLALDLPSWPGEGAEPEVWLHYPDGVDPEWLHPLPGQPVARLPVTRRQPLHLLRLPDQPGLGLRTVTLVGRGAATAEGG